MFHDTAFSGVVNMEIVLTALRRRKQTNKQTQLKGDINLPSKQTNNAHSFPTNYFSRKQNKKETNRIKKNIETLTEK